MNSLKKKILAGLLSGAIIFTSGLAINSAQAAENSTNQQRVERQHRERPQMSEEQRSQRIKEFAEHYGVNQSEVEAALKNHTDFRDLQQAAIETQRQIFFRSPCNENRLAASCRKTRRKA